MGSTIKNQYTPDKVSPPRATLRELLEERGMSQTELAKRMGKTQKAVNEILSDAADVAITPETALQLERALGLPAGFWLKREQAYREAEARLRERELHSKEIGWLDCLPLGDLRKRGLISASGKSTGAVREALSFFGVASVDSWKLFWSKAEVAYRMSSTFESEIGHLAAWLRCGEVAASKLGCAEYSAKRFERTLSEARKLTTASINEITDGLVSLCAAAGVAVVFVREFPKTHVCGAARWISGGRLPVICLSLRHKTDDHMWFTFFHEACHVLRHGKKSIYVDDKNPDGARVEEEANRFARNILIPEDDYKQFVRSHDIFYEDTTKAFAKSIGVAPGIVVGRLQHDGLLAHHCQNDLKRRFEFFEERVVELPRSGGQRK